MKNNIRKMVSIAVCLLILSSALMVVLPQASSQPSRGVGAPIVIQNQKFPKDLVKKVEHQKGGAIEVKIANNVVGRDLKLFVRSNENIIEIKIEVLGNKVGRDLIVLVEGNGIDRQMGKDIKTTVSGNRVAQDMKVRIKDNWVKLNLNTGVLDNLVGRDIQVKVHKENIVSNMNTNVERNTACNKLEIIESKNIIDKTLSTKIKENRITKEIKIEINKNKNPKDWEWLFNKMTVEIIDNHVIVKDIKIEISGNVMSYTSSQVDITIQKNGAAKKIDIKILVNKAAFDGKITTMDITIDSNGADESIEIRILNNKVGVLTVKTINNTAFKRVPKPNVQKDAIHLNSGNKIEDKQQGADGDGDGLADNYEKMIGTDHTKKDTDDDGLYDGWDDTDGNRKWKSGERHGELGDPRQKKGTRNKGSISTLFNKKKEEPKPLCQDIYVEVDQMRGHKLPKASIDKVIKAFFKQRISLHIDAGWGQGSDRSGKGGETIPHTDPFWAFRHAGANNDFYDFKKNYFSPKRQGIFHYTIIGHMYQESNRSTGCVPNLAGVVDADDIFMADHWVKEYAKRLKVNLNVARAGAFMHELAHNMGVTSANYAGIDNGRTFPLAPNYDPDLYVNYESVLNYHYTLSGPVDYSDGTHGSDKYGNADFDDWSAIKPARIADKWNVYEG